MNTHRTHNPVLEQRLRNFIVRRDAEGLSGCLKELSNADFRTSGILLRECLLTELQGEDFWKFFLTIVPTNSRAYLGTFLKAAAVLYEYDSISLASPALDTFAAQAWPSFLMCAGWGMLKGFLNSSQTTHRVLASATFCP